MRLDDIFVKAVHILNIHSSGVQCTLHLKNVPYQMLGFSKQIYILSVIFDFWFEFSSISYTKSSYLPRQLPSKKRRANEIRNRVTVVI